MDPVQRFSEYAEAFEDVFKSDDWSLLEPYFSEDAVYETIAEGPFAGRQDGRDAVFAQLKQTLDTFDRRFDSRTLDLQEGPLLREGKAWIRWRVTYAKAGAPDLVLEGEETAEFEGDRIRRLEDRFTEASARGALEWMGAHGAKLAG